MIACICLNLLLFLYQSYLIVLLFHFTEDVRPPAVESVQKPVEPLPHVEPAATADAQKVDKQEVEKQEAEEELTSYELEHLEDVLEHIAEEKKIELEKSELEALREDVDEYQEVLTTLHISNNEKPTRSCASM